MNFLNRLPFFTRKYIEALKLLYRAPNSFLKAKRNKNISASTLIISFPRSGSSWVGAILGCNDSSLYLREPVTTSYMLEKPNRVSVLDLNNYQDSKRYQHFINQALNGKAKRLNAIFKYPKQLNQQKNALHLVIKEVNPLAIEKYGKAVNNTVYLLRHPYAVAQSYYALNWQTPNLFANRFSPESLNKILESSPTLLQEDFWTQMGFLLGWIEAKTKYLLNGHHMIVRYEDICASPETQFESLCRFTSLNYSETLKRRLTQSISGKQSVKKGDFSLQRNLEDVSMIKICDSDKPKYDKLIAAYLLAGMRFNNLHHATTSLSYHLESRFIKWTKN